MARSWEWDCAHGVGHPKPDAVNQIHGCDGCCTPERVAAVADQIIQNNHESGEAREHLQEPKATFEGGSTRSEKSERYDLVPVEIDEALARRFGLGASKHGPHNWKGGGADFIASCLNHLRGHYVSLMKNGPFHSDDDIGAMLWNAGVLAWFRVHKPEEFLKALGMTAQTPADDHSQHPI